MLKDFLVDKPTIETQRLTIRPLCIDDVPALREWTSDKSIYKFWGKNPGKIDKNPELLFEQAPKPTKSFHLGIIENRTDKAVGELWIYQIENDRMAKVALRLSPAVHNCGFATEAIRAITNFCFEQTELQRIWTDVNVNNTASCRVLEKCGFTREGLIRQGKMVSTWCDYYVYGLLKSDLQN